MQGPLLFCEGGDNNNFQGHMIFFFFHRAILCAIIFLTPNKRPWIVESTFSIFPRGFPYTICFPAVFFLCRIFFLVIAQPPRPPQKSNGLSLNLTVLA